MILKCPECGKKLRVRDELAGKRGKCPGCGKLIVVAAPKSDKGARRPAKLGFVARLKLKRLVREVSGKDSSVAARAASALGEFRHPRAVEALAAALEGQHVPYVVARSATEALRKIGGYGAVGTLVKCLRSRRVRSDAAAELEKLAWEPRSTGDQIDYLVAKGEWEKLAGLGRSALDPLVAVLRQREEEFGSLGPRRKAEAVDELVQLVEVGTQLGRSDAKEALRRILANGEREMRELAQRIVSSKEMHASYSRRLEAADGLVERVDPRSVSASELQALMSLVEQETTWRGWVKSLEREYEYLSTIRDKCAEALSRLEPPTGVVSGQREPGDLAGKGARPDGTSSEEGAQRAWCDFCNKAISEGEGGIANVDLFPGYPAGRRRQSLGCVECLRQRGADGQQLAVAKAAAKAWWKPRQNGEDRYITRDMLGLASEPAGGSAEENETSHRFRMRIESIFPSGAGVMVAGPVETGSIEVGATVDILHRGKKHSARIKDVQSLMGRSAFLLEGISADAVGKGDVLLGD